MIARIIQIGVMLFLILAFTGQIIHDVKNFLKK